MPSASALKTLATYEVKSKTPAAIAKGNNNNNPKLRILVSIARGSVLDFTGSTNPSHTNTAIVNAANEGCLGGGGVDGAISNAGGEALYQDRLALPVLEEASGMRCPTGGAVITGPNDNYGKLNVNHVIHAVGPNYWNFDTTNTKADEDDDNDGRNFSEPDSLLRSAYQTSLDCAHKANIQSIGFSLLSAGIFRGSRSLDDIMNISVAAIKDWIVDQQQEETSEESTTADESNNTDIVGILESITLCGFSEKETATLLKACESVEEFESLQLEEAPTPEVDDDDEEMIVEGEDEELSTSERATVDSEPEEEETFEKAKDKEIVAGEKEEENESSPAVKEVGEGSDKKKDDVASKEVEGEQKSDETEEAATSASKRHIEDVDGTITEDVVDSKKQEL